MIAEIIGAGLGILGSLMNGDDEPKEVTSYVDYGRMVRDAEAAGFNPLTAIRNGGSAGFTTTTTPGLSSSAMVGRALGQAGNFIANFDPMADQKKELEYQLVEAQLANLQANTEAQLRQSVRFGDVPTYTAGNQKRVMGAGVDPAHPVRPLAEIVASGDLDGKDPEANRPTRVNPYPSYLTSLGWQINPWTTSAQDDEDWLGDNEVNSMLKSVSQYGHDIAWNGYRLTRYLHGAATKGHPTKLGNYGKPYTGNPVFQ